MSGSVVPAQAAARQQVGELTVEPVRIQDRTWWVWRAASGRQVHAGLDSRQFVDGRWFDLDASGRWAESGRDGL